MHVLYAHRCKSPVKSNNQVGRFYHMTFRQYLESENNAEVIGQKVAKCVRIKRWRKSLVIFAGDQIRRDQRIKSPSASPALRSYDKQTYIDAIKKVIVELRF